MIGIAGLHQTQRSVAIGVIPKPETRSTDRRRAGREVFGEAIDPNK